MDWNWNEAKYPQREVFAEKSWRSQGGRISIQSARTNRSTKSDSLWVFDSRENENLQTSTDLTGQQRAFVKSILLTFLEEFEYKQSLDVQNCSWRDHDRRTTGTTNPHKICSTSLEQSLAQQSLSLSSPWPKSLQDQERQSWPTTRSMEVAWRRSSPSCLVSLSH